MKKQGVAVILALFFGGFGIHKFYLGRGAAGILYLLFCWTFIPLLLSIIDFFILLSMPEREFNNKFNSEYRRFLGIENLQESRSQLLF